MDTERKETNDIDDIENLKNTLESLKNTEHTYKSCIYERTNDDGTKFKSGLYDLLIGTPKVMDAFINATCGLGTAPAMDDDMKCDWFDQSTFDDVIMLWNSGWM